ncbi:hypothetical protein GF373_02635 [bacterium]|nr:hypothetical protein [bacterium]
MRFFTLFIPLFISLCLSMPASLAEPVPGEVFREYTWFNEEGDAGQSLRVGGKHGNVHPDRGSAHGYINAPVKLEHDFDLRFAVKAEVNIEKILCHDDTKGLAIQINGHDWLTVPESETIPYPQWDYQHHTYPTIQVPLSFLREGTGNTFRMRVSPEQRWGWPQNLINGVHFRIYYDPARKPQPSGAITSLESGDTIGERVQFACQAESTNGAIRRVEYVGYYKDVDFEGEGIYTQWHYHFYHGELTNHIGTADEAPYRVAWDTSWLPDQDNPVQIAARIVDETGLIKMTEPVAVKLRRPGISVELCKPYQVPQLWVTRRGEMEEKFFVRGDLNKAVAAQLAWASWSPGYMNGIYINGKKVFHSEGPNYQYHAHRVPLDSVMALRQGENTLTTGKTPKYNGHMVHGMEVNWPGIMVLVKFLK